MLAASAGQKRGGTVCRVKRQDALEEALGIFEVGIRAQGPEEREEEQRFRLAQIHDELLELLAQVHKRLPRTAIALRLRGEGAVEIMGVVQGQPWTTLLDLVNPQLWGHRVSFGLGTHGLQDGRGR